MVYRMSSTSGIMLLIPENKCSADTIKAYGVPGKIATIIPHKVSPLTTQDPEEPITERHRMLTCIAVGIVVSYVLRGCMYLSLTVSKISPLMQKCMVPTSG